MQGTTMERSKLQALASLLLAHQMAPAPNETTI